MRFSSLLVAVSAIAATEAQFEQYKAQFQNFLNSFGVKIPGSDANGAAPGAGSGSALPDTEAAPEAKVVKAEISVLTLSNWKDTLYGPVTPSTSTPEEWWVLITGGNKTCQGYCGKAEAAFNETADKFATIPGTPHMGYINCEQENILCHTLKCWPGSLWVFDMLPPPAAINIYGKRLNLSTIEAADLVMLQASDSKKESFSVVRGWWHPFDGPVAEYGLLVPAGYVSWVFSFIPNWLFMFLISIGSRFFMNRRMRNFGGQQQAAGAGGAAGAAAGGAGPA